MHAHREPRSNEEKFVARYPAAKIKQAPQPHLQRQNCSTGTPSPGQWARLAPSRGLGPPNFLGIVSSFLGEAPQLTLTQLIPANLNIRQSETVLKRYPAPACRNFTHFHHPVLGDELWQSSGTGIIDFRNRYSWIDDIVQIL